MSIAQLLRGGGNLSDVGKLVDPRYNNFGPPVNTGGDDPTKGLTARQRSEWNHYVDWLEAKGMKGSTKLDKRETGLASGLFNQFKKENPDVTLTLDNISLVQTEMQKLQQSARGFAERRGDKNAEGIMEGISQIDNWPGSKTTSFKFPSMSIQEFRNNELVTKRNLGLVDSSLRPEGDTTRTLPKGAKLETMADGRQYYEDKEGNMILYK
jgi:hypothetical protein